MSDHHYHHYCFNCYHQCLSSLLSSLSWLLLSSLLSLKPLSPLEHRYLKYYLEYNSGNKLVSILTFRKFLPISPTKRCQPRKTEMKSKYQTGSSCTPVNKTRIKNFSCGYSRYTNLSLVSQLAKSQKKIQITFKNNKFRR